jgi:hypothetical protein
MADRRDPNGYGQADYSYPRSTNREAFRSTKRLNSRREELRRP